MTLKITPFVVGACLLVAWLAGTIEDAKKGPAYNSSCRVSKSTPGETAYITFFFRRSINMKSDELYAHVIKQGTDRDILRCLRPKKTSPVECDVIHSGFESEGIVNHSVTVFIPNITHGFQGVYEFHYYVNNSFEDAVICKLTLEPKRARTTDTDNNDAETGATDVNIAWVAVLVLIPVVALTVCLYWRRRRSRRRAIPVEFKGKRWYFGKLEPSKDEELLLLPGNKHGSFLVRESNTIKNSYTMAVRNGEYVCFFRIKHCKEDSRFYIIEAEKFKNVADLVHYYREHTDFLTDPCVVTQHSDESNL